jgi:hypothetical protein
MKNVIGLKQTPEQAALNLLQDGGGYVRNTNGKSINVLLHKSVERLAAMFDVNVDVNVMAADLKEKSCIIRAIAKRNGLTIATTGESHPINNDFPFFVAVAEKRAVDRAVLKILNLHGDYFSQEEMREETISNVGVSLDEANVLKQKLIGATHIGNFNNVLSEYKDYLEGLSKQDKKTAAEIATVIQNKQRQLDKGDNLNG